MVPEGRKFHSQILTGNLQFQTFQRLNKTGVTQSRDSLLNIMDSVAGDIKSEVKQVLQTNSSLRIVFDNLDFTVLANIILKSNRNSDMHWIGHYVTFDRVPSSHLDNTHPLMASINEFDNTEYLLSENELRKLKSDFTVLVARVLVEFFTCLNHLKSAVAIHIPHR